jgi:taurine dioxygenase
VLTIEPTGAILGATIRGLDLRKPLDKAAVGTILQAIGRYGVLRFPAQTLEPVHLRDFTASFGEVQHSKGYTVPGWTQVSVISNVVVDGKNIGYTDSGLVWHRDMTYRGQPGFANVLYAEKVPRRDGKALGDTGFLNSAAVYADLPKDVQRRLIGTRGVHDNQFYSSTIRDKFGARDTVYHTRSSSPQNSHPVLMTHPITGKTVVYCDVGHVVRIEGEGLSEKEGEALLTYLREVQTRPQYEYFFNWTEGDVVMWDNIGTLHRGNQDYTADEHRLVKRCQALGDKIFDPAFMKAALAEAQLAA